MATYGLLLHGATGLPVRGAVVLLEPGASVSGSYELRHGAHPICVYCFEVLRLDDVPAVELAADADLAVLTPLGGASSLEALGAAKCTILREIPRPGSDDLLAALYFVAGRRFGELALRRLFQEEELMYSSTYQATAEKWMRKGREQGLEEGLEKGIEKGIKKGRETALRAVLARMVHARFPTADLEPLLARCTPDQLEAFAEQLVLAEDAALLKRWLLARLD